MPQAPRQGWRNHDRDMSRHTSHRRRHREPTHLILARGDEVKSVIVHRWMIWAGSLAAVGVTFWLCAATAYVVFRDDVLSAMMTRQARMQHTYEDRIAQLRLQIDRVTSRQLLDQEAFTVRVDELLRRQQAIEARSVGMGGVVERARGAGIAPQPAADTTRTGTIMPRLESGDRVARIEVMLGAVEKNLETLSAVQDQTLALIETRLRETDNRMRSAIADLGLQPERLAGAPRPRASAVGGPLVPLAAGSIDPFRARTEAIEEQLAWIDRLRRGLGPLPVRRPVREPDISSGFGPRMDPFLGVPALHSGLDFRGPTGEPILAAGSGTIVSAGRAGGYGLMVEIDHGHDLTTRYAHLSSIAVQEGQRVSSGQIIGRLGSTGRSTGPHLHWETRIDGEAVDPQRFIRAGRTLGLW